MDEQNRLLFVLPSGIPKINRGVQPPVSPGNGFYSSKESKLIVPNNRSKGQTNMMKTAQQAWNAIPSEMKEQAKAKVVEIGTSEIKRRFSGDGGSGSGSNEPIRRGHSSGYALSNAPNPKIVNLDSGIKPCTYTSDYITPEEDKCSVLHLSAALIQIPSASTNLLNTYFKQISAFDLQTKAQANISFNLNVTTDFSTTNILDAMNTLLAALQVYFFYTSIISYHSDPANNNQGMIALRQSFTPQMIEDLTILGRRLADTPVPPKFYELIRYMSGTFSSGLDPDTPLIKTVPHYLNGSTILRTDVIASYTSLLNNDAYNKVYTLLRRAIPQWNPKVLYDAPSTPIYDRNFNTIFANLPFTNFVASYDPRPQVANSSEIISYNSFSNALDGLAFAMCGVYNTGTNPGWIPGLISVPTATNIIGTENSRRSYYVVSGTFGFYVVKDYPFLVKARNETYYNNTSTTIASAHLYGATKCLNVNADTIRETSMKAIDYLMSAETIKTDKGSFSKSYNNRDSRGK